MQCKTSNEILFKPQPPYDHIMVFGSLCYAISIKGQKINLNVIAEGVFVGYPYEKKGRRVYKLEMREIFVSFDVILHEDNFPFYAKNGAKKIDFPHANHQDQVIQFLNRLNSWGLLLMLVSVMGRPTVSP